MCLKGPELKSIWGSGGAAVGGSWGRNLSKAWPASPAQLGSRFWFYCGANSGAFPSAGPAAAVCGTMPVLLQEYHAARGENSCGCAVSLPGWLHLAGGETSWQAAAAIFGALRSGWEAGNAFLHDWCCASREVVKKGGGGRGKYTDFFKSSAAHSLQEQGVD